MSSPSGSVDRDTKCVVVDSWFDQYRGVISLISVIDGIIKPGINQVLIVGDCVVSCAHGKVYEVLQVGIMHPEQQTTDSL